MATHESDSGQDAEHPQPYQQMKSMFAQRTVEACATHLLPYIRPNYRILDVGCGPGSITLGLARLVPEGEVIGVDINEESISLARDLAKQQNCPNVHFEIGDALNLSQYSDNSFDLVHAHQVLLHVSNPTLAFRELHRVTKPIGLLSTRDNAHALIIPPTPVLDRNRAMFCDLMVSRGADPWFGQRNHVVAKEVGFEWEGMEMSSWAFEYSGPEGRRVWAEGAKNALRAPAVKAGLASEEEMDGVAEAWEKWAQDPQARFVGLDGAVVCWK